MGHRLTERSKVALASLVSVLLHCLAAGLAGMLLAFRGEPETHSLPSQTPEELELTIMEPLPAPAPPTRFVEIPADRVSEHPPEKPLFESDADSVAASKRSASGNLPLPSQEGVNLPGMHFNDQQLTLSRETNSKAERAPQESPPQAAELAPMPTPAPRKIEAESRAEPTPPPDALALLDPTSRMRTSLATPKPNPTPTPQRDAMPSLPSPPQNVPDSASPPGYQPERRTTKIEGSVDSRGRSSVDSVATPLGRYRKALSEAIGSRWYYYTTSRIDLISLGAARLRFYVKADGSVEDIEIISNTSNASFGTFTLQAILEAEIPPIPPDIVQTLENNRLEVEYTFTVYGGR